MSLRSCRLCLDESEDLMDIFHQSWEKNKYQLKIHKLFSLLIKPNDPLSCICVKCVDQIDSFYPFWVQVKQSQVKLCQELAGHEHCSDGVSMDGVKLEPNDNEEMNSEVILRVTDQKNNSDTFKSEGSLKYQAPKMEETNKQHTCQRSQSQLEMKLAPSHIGNSDTSNSQVADSFPEYKRNDSESSSSPHLAVDYLDTDGDLSEVEESYEVPKAKRQKCNKNNTLQTNTNVDFLKFPTEIMKDGKLIIERHQLTEIINQFYNLQCNLCQKKEKFTRVFLLMQHMKEVHKTRGYLTCHCGVRLHYNSAIRFHMVQHLQPSALQCSICEKNFTRPITLVSHMKTHLSPGEKSKWYKCDQCEKGCNSKSELEDHIQSSHVPEKNRVIYKCKICEKGYILKGLLYQHTHREHSAPKSSKFLCSECGKTYKNVAALRIHITVNHDNTGKNKIQCKHCGVVCKNIYCFKAHMKKHTGTKFMCDRCPYFTHRSTLLKIHVRVKHTDEKPYSCAECGKCFKHKSQVQNHMPQHTGEAKFACSFCPRMFMSQSNCFTHRKKMHPEEYNNEKSRKLKEKLKGIETQLSTEKVEPEKIYQLAKKYLSKVSKRPTPKVPN